MGHTDGTMSYSLNKKGFRMWVLTMIYLVHVLNSNVHGKRILMTPAQGVSHIMQFKNMGEALVEQGHEVYMLLSPTTPNMVDTIGKTKIKVLAYHTPLKDLYTDSISKESTVDQWKSTCPVDTMDTAGSSFSPFCENSLSDENLFQKIKDLNFDLGFGDAIPFARCHYILFYKLDLPYVSFFGGYNPWLFRAYPFPTVSPWSMGPPYDPNQDFWQRLNSAWKFVWWNGIYESSLNNDQLVKRFAPEKPLVTISDLVSKSYFWFTDSNPIIDYPRPVASHEEMVGGLTVKPPKPLPKDLQDYMDAATEGVIIMSFGSFAPDLHDDIFFEAFSNIKQKVIWRFSGAKPQNVPSNVNLIKWLPQNDLLGHPNTKIFITHCGANGQFEALYNSVPMIGFPIFAEQYYNRERMVYHGFGLGMDIDDFESEELVETINIILSNSTFYENIAQASKIFRSSAMTPTQKVVYWTQHVLDFGGKHLRSPSLDKPWYQFYMIDILIFVELSFVIIIFITVYFSQYGLIFASLGGYVLYNTFQNVLITFGGSAVCYFIFQHYLLQTGMRAV